MLQIEYPLFKKKQYEQSKRQVSKSYAYVQYDSSDK